MIEPGNEPGAAPDAGAVETVAWLRGRDASCPICSYNVRDVERAICPECGAALSLTLTSPTLGVGPWSLAIVSFALGLGFDGVVLVLMSIAWILEGGTPPPPAVFFIMTLAVLCAGSGLGLLWVIKRRSLIQRRSRKDQWRLAVGIFLLVGVVHAVAGLAVMAGFGTF